MNERVDEFVVYVSSYGDLRWLASGTPYNVDFYSVNNSQNNLQSRHTNCAYFARSPVTDSEI